MDHSSILIVYYFTLSLSFFYRIFYKRFTAFSYFKFKINIFFKLCLVTCLSRCALFIYALSYYSFQKNFIFFKSIQTRTFQNI